MGLRAQVTALNDMILQGQVLDAFEKFYADDVVMQENEGEERVGKDVCRQYEQAFVGGLTAFRSAEVKAVAVDEENGVAMTEWFFDFTHRDWGDVARHQVAVQRWRDGKIVHERFYYGT